jgi:hypothetical protein
MKIEQKEWGKQQMDTCHKQRNNESQIKAVNTG